MLKKRVENPKMTDREYNAHLLRGDVPYEHCEFCGDAMKMI